MKQITKAQLEDIVEYISDNIGGYIYNSAAQNIAPTEATTTTSQEYKVGEQFYYNKILYTAIVPIANGGTIVISGENKNCEPSPTLTKQLADLGTASAKNSTSVVTQSSDLVESGAVKDIVGWGNKNLLDPELLSTYALTYAPIYVGDGEFTISTTAPLNSSDGANLFFLAGNVQTGASTSVNGVWNGQTRTVTAVDGYVTVVSRGEGGVNVRNYNNQLERGSTATAYEPYHASVEEYCASKQLLEDTVGWVGDNKIKRTLNDVKNSTTSSVWDGNETTLNGITFDVNTDQNGYISSIRAHGQLITSSGASLRISNRTTYPMHLPIGTYKLNSGVNSGNIILVLGRTYNGTWQQLAVSSGIDAVFTIESASDDLGLSIDVYNTSPIDYTFYPTITLLNVDEKKADNSVIGTVEDGATASQAYAVGDYFIKDTILGKTKAPIASGGTFTKDTNYEETNVAKEITELYKYIGILTTPVEAFTANSLPMLKRNITNAFYNGSLRAEIAAGNFKNVRPGDYIIGQATGSIYYVVECDYWLGNGDSTNGTTYPAYNTHHLGLMLFKPVGTTALWRGYGYSDKSWRVSASDLGRCPWNAEINVDPTDTEAIGSNSTNITRSYNGTNMSAYMGSFIRERIDAILLPQCFQADFGSENVLKRRNWLSNAINASAASGARSDWQGIASGSVWVDRFIDLPSEVELYGSRINSSSRDDIGVQNKQLPIYRNGRIHDFYPRMDLWTKGVASAAGAASRANSGSAHAHSASSALWACPLGCVK